ncbi:MAG: SCO family protein [Sphingobacteriaceae bacterium]|nr:MAG: SCO family protein [Sphingobacteriaceae bacterium]
MIKNILGAFMLVLLLNACTSNDTKTLPIYGEREPVTKTVNGEQVTDTVYHTIPAFGFVNQYGDSVTNKTLDDKIYVADFFFTSCPSICPIMHRNMLNVYNAYKNVADFKIVSYSIDPKYDTVARLKKYADGLNITGNTWWLLRGDKEATYTLSKSYLVTTPREDEKEKFIHDGYFLLIDKQKRIRGTYDGTDETQVTQLIEDIKTLRAEPEQIATK